MMNRTGYKTPSERNAEGKNNNLRAPYEHRVMFDYSLVDETVKRIAEKFSPEKIIIFGSVAKGTADEYSDLDILVVMKSDKQPYERAVPIYLAVAGIRVPKDIIVLTPEEFAAQHDNEYSFASEIAQTGVVAYEA